MYYVNRNGEQFGPYSEIDLRRMLRERSFVGSDYGWTEGMTEWLSLADLFPGAVTGPQPPAFAPRAQAGFRAGNATNQHLLYESQKKSAGLACALNFILPGVGYMYAGRWIIGIFVFCFWALCVLLAFVTFGITAFGAAVIWFVGIIDGFLAVNRANRKLAERLMFQ